MHCSMHCVRSLKLSPAEELLPDLDELDSKAIAPSLADFSFSKNPFAVDEAPLFVDDIPHIAVDDDDDNEGFAMAGDGIAGDPLPEEDFFVGDQGINDDIGDGMSPDNFGAEDGEQGS